MIATVQANTADQRSTIFDLRSSDIRLEDRVRDLKTLVGQRAGGAAHPGIRRRTCRARPCARHPGPVAGDAVAKPVTNRSWGSTGDAQQVTGPATSGLAWGHGAVGRSWRTAKSAVVVVKTPDNQANKCLQYVWKVASSVSVAPSIDGNSQTT